MKYKIGDKIQIKSWDQLVSEIENGLEFKSNQFSTNIKNGNIFCLKKDNIDNIQNESLTIIGLFDENTTFTLQEERGIFPIEFIKEKNVFKLPDELFKME